MKSQVSFCFDGEHNKQPIIDILRNRLKGLKYEVKKENDFVYRIYVASDGDEQTTFDVCYGIQDHVVIDHSLTF